jgi:hypothetical protein
LRKPQPRINEIKHLRGRSPFYCSSRVKTPKAKEILEFLRHLEF